MNTFLFFSRKTVLLMVFFAFQLGASAQWSRSSGPEGGYASAILATQDFVLVGLEDGGVYRSTDLGATWHFASYGLTAEGAGGNCFAVLGPYVYVGSDRGVSRSTDEGMTWSALDVGAPWYGILVSSLVTDGSTIYLGSPWQGVYASTDSGATWVKKSHGLADSVVMALLIDEGYLYAGTDGGGIYRSTDDGDSWQPASTGLGTGNAQRVYNLASAGGTIVAGTRAAAYRSTDHGTSWSLVTSGMSSRDVASLGTNGTDFLAGTYGAGVYRSTDGGDNWAWSSTGWTSGNVRAFGSIGGVIFAASYGDSVVYKSTDGGSQWSPSKSGITSESIIALGSDGGNILAATNDGLTISGDAGITWNNISELQSNAMYSIGIFGGWIFVGTGGQGVFASSDHGASWNDANGNLPGSGWRPVYAVASDTVYVYIGTNTGVYRSSDHGVTWEPAKSGLTDTLVHAMCAAEGRLFAGTNPLMFISSDHGSSWTASLNGLPTYDVAVTSIVSIDHTVLASYALGGNPTVYKTTDGGSSWYPTSQGLTSYSKTIQTLHVEGNNVFGGTSFNGVWLSTDRGENWTDISEGLTGPGLAVSALTTAGGNLYAGMERGGVWKRPLSEVVVSVSQPQQDELQGEFQLQQNYPNPFNPTTTIQVIVGGVVAPSGSEGPVSGQLTADSRMRLEIYDVLGRMVAVLADGKYRAGRYSFTFDGTNFASGVYFYRLTAGSHQATRVMILAK